MPVEPLVIAFVFIAAAEPGIDEADPLPDIEMLEFLGNWETASGEWIDPSAWSDEPEVAAEPQEEEKSE